MYIRDLHGPNFSDPVDLKAKDVFGRGLARENIKEIKSKPAQCNSISSKQCRYCLTNSIIPQLKLLTYLCKFIKRSISQAMEY